MGFERIRKNKEFILYGISLAVLFILIRTLQFRFLVISHSFEFYVGCIALLFMALGIWLTRKLTHPKVETVIIERKLNAADFVPNEQELAERKISKRELEVLQLMADGMSNKEIADSLFVSLNTIKSHSSNLFEKLEVKRRTQAVETAKKLGILS